MASYIPSAGSRRVPPRIVLLVCELEDMMTAAKSRLCDLKHTVHGKQHFRGAVVPNGLHRAMSVTVRSHRHMVAYHDNVEVVEDLIHERYVLQRAQPLHNMRQHEHHTDTCHVHEERIQRKDDSNREREGEGCTCMNWTM